MQADARVNQYGSEDPVSMDYLEMSSYFGTGHRVSEYPSGRVVV